MSDCPFKGGIIPGGWDKASAFDIPTTLCALRPLSESSRGAT